MLEILNTLNNVPVLVGTIISVLVPLGMGIVGVGAVLLSKRK